MICSHHDKVFQTKSNFAVNKNLRSTLMQGWFYLMVVFAFV
jgi:hypothetical protein